MSDPREPSVTAAPGTELPGERTGVILTPDQRVRVFISSTLQELAEERAAARRAIARLHLVPVWYESGARPHPPRSMYRAYLDQSQVFVGIYWQRYGWVAPGMEISGLEDEYRLAAGKPMLLYVKRPAPDQEPRLAALLDAIRDAGTVSYRAFATPRELERLLADDLAVLLSESFAGAALSTEASPARSGEPGEELPAGTVTFLLTDIEGSTRLWESVPDAMEVALERHNRLLTEVIENHGGVVVTSRGEGDSFFAVFPGVVAAVEAAGACQLRLKAEAWPEGAVLRVRMGLHTGEARARGSSRIDHAPINRCARVKAAAYGGQVLVTKATRDLAGGRLGGGFGLKRLGQFRLRDLAEPELIYQLTHADLSADFPPLKTIRSGNVPVQATSFVGRAGELREIAQALAQSRLVTLTGVGGVGKTRLSVEVASQTVGEYPDGCWFCDLAPARDGDTVLRIIASSLGAALRPGVSLETSITEHCKARQLLAVLDNCEQVLDPAAEIAGTLLRECSGVRILATSREALDVDGEQVFAVGSLSVPEPAMTAEHIEMSDAVRLFADRAGAVQRGFRLDAGSAKAAAEITRRLDGIPLAIELAAARVAVLPVPRIAALLDERFQLLTGGRRTSPERHQTLRATIDWSYGLLTGEEQRVFDCLGVFPGTFDLDAAAAVMGAQAGPWAVLDTLAALVSKSMVIPDQVHGPEARYRLLETLRQYGLERLRQRGELDAVQRRHAQHFAAFAKQAGTALLGPDELAWRPRSRAEQDNLRAAVQWGLGSASPDDGMIAVDIAASLAAYAPYEAAGGIASLVAQTAERAQTLSRDQRIAILGAAAFDAFQNRGDVQLAEQLARGALRDGVTPGNPGMQAYAALVMSQTFTGRLPEARATLSEAIQATQLAGVSNYDRAGALGTSAAAHALMGDIENARESADAALAQMRRTGNPSGLASTLCWASMTRVRDDPGQALAFAEQSIALTRAGASGSVFGHVLPIRAQLRARDGDIPGAVRDLREAITYSHGKGDKVMLMAAFDRGITVFDSLGLAEPAAVLAGVALRGPLAVLSILPPTERDDRAVLLEQVRTLTGRTAYERAVAQGAAMNNDEAVTYALDALDSAETQSLAQSAVPDAPGGRERRPARRDAPRRRARPSSGEGTRGRR
jgi:predicted ATPase/class 3 adenylate cyclase